MISFLLFLSLFNSYEEITCGRYVVSEYIDILKQNQIYCDGTGASALGDIRYFTISLVSPRKCDLKEARKLYVSIVENFLIHINSKRYVRPWLHEYPCPWSGVKVSLALDHQEPSANYIFTARGIVIYRAWENGKYVFFHEETIEEAVRLAHAEN